MTASELIVFTHIQKTAGTTFGRVLKAKYGFWPVSNFVRLNLVLGLHRYHVEGDFPLDRIRAIESLTEHDRRRVRLLQGHMGFGVHQYFEQPFQYITVLREPVARVLSHYGQMRNQHWCPFRDEMRERTASEFLREHPIDALSNYQVKLLAGVYQEVPGNTVPYCATESTPGLLDKAIEHLDRYYLVALTELFDESMLLMKASLGWRNAYYIKSNVTKRRRKPEAPPSEALDEIRSHNQLDVALYEHARKRLEQAIDAQPPGFRDELARFRVRNDRLNRLLYYPVDGLMKMGRALNSLGRKERRSSAWNGSR